MIVLHYISNRDKRFQTFVANRLAKIHEHSEISQWRHVDSLSLTQLMTFLGECRHMRLLQVTAGSQGRNFFTKERSTGLFNLSLDNYWKMQK